MRVNTPAFNPNHSNLTNLPGMGGPTQSPFQTAPAYNDGNASNMNTNLAKTSAEFNPRQKWAWFVLCFFKF
jgi:hypothetical protein